MVTVKSLLGSAEGRGNGSIPASGDNLPLQPALTLLIALLIPCVVLLLLLNCVLLLQRLPANPQARKRSRNRGRQQVPAWSCDLDNLEGLSAIADTSSQGPGAHPSQEVRLTSTSVVSQGVDVAIAVGEGRRTRVRPHSRQGLHKPDGTDGEYDACSLRPPIVVTVSKAPQKHGAGGLRRLPDWNHGRVSQITVSSGDTEGRAIRVPPNTPATTPVPQVTPTLPYVQKTSTGRKVRHNPLLIVSPLDSVNIAHASGIPHDHTAIPFSANSSFAGPGLDSDFGASAEYYFPGGNSKCFDRGVSLRILSSDSDSCSYSWVSGLEWDYYDPVYRRRNQRRMQRHQFPVLCSKQYWV